MLWRCRDRHFDLTERVLVMGVVNVTPDSFSDGGRFLAPDAAAAHARALAAAGADLIDLGAESTRPGADPVPDEEQWRRLAPVLQAIAGVGLTISVDTASPAVARRALEAGAHVVNDVTALLDPAMAPLVAATGAGVVLMHAQGTPRTMQQNPTYADVAGEVREHLAAAIATARAAGVEDDRIVVDPGIGFGKTPRHNLELLARLPEIAELKRPILIGASRKGFIGKVLDLPVEERLEGGLAVAAVAVFQGARLVRTHDVEPTARAARMAEAIRQARR